MARIDCVEVQYNRRPVRDPMFADFSAPPNQQFIRVRPEGLEIVDVEDNYVLERIDATQYTIDEINQIIQLTCEKNECIIDKIRLI